MENKLKVLLISDFNIDNLARILQNNTEDPLLKVETSLFGQVHMLLANSNNMFNGQNEAVVVWTQPEAIVPSFKMALNFKSVPISDIYQEVDAFAYALTQVSGQITYLLVASWELPCFFRGHGLLDLRKETGIADILNRMNVRLSDKLNGLSNIYIMNSRKWQEKAGTEAFNAKLWYSAKIPFSNEVFFEAADDIVSALRNISGQARKLIVLDLDNTLWGGVVGDIGWENIRLGGHDYIGEAYLDFQKMLKSYTNRGIILGVVSKNQESVALDAIEKHPEMQIRKQDLAGWKINWQDKAQNIVDLVSELNLGLQSVVFIDDHPFERNWVRQALPEVLVPEWPEDCCQFTRAFSQLKCFDQPFISEEDKLRSQMYDQERKRKSLKQVTSSLGKFLEDLEIKIKVERINPGNLPRVVQLLNKTNQMNLSTRRISLEELKMWADKSENDLWSFRVSDKFGDYGLTGVISWTVEAGIVKIVDFVLSCRVLGRSVEEAMLYAVFQQAKRLGAQEIHAQHVLTQRNQPCLDFFKRSGLIYQEPDSLFILRIKENYKLPKSIQLEMETA